MVAMPVLSAVLVALALTLPAPDQGLQGPFAPALRITPPVQEVEAPSWSRCPGLYAAAIEGWPNAEEVWYRLDFIAWRESRCSRTALNRFGCAGALQVCTGNFRRLGVTRYDLFDPVTSFRAGYQLCQEQVQAGRSCWRPWHTRGWRP